ncbi:MAG: UPF0236 family protein [Anaerolineaceae bacterium]
MTITVRLSINVEVEKGEGKKIEAEVRPEHFEEDIRQLRQTFTELTGREVLAGYEAQLKQGEYRKCPSIRTEERTYQFQAFSLCYRRRSYRMPDGRECTPLDGLLGFEKYQRRSWKANEQISAIASSLSYRKTSQINTYISKGTVSASTVCRSMRLVGKRIEEQEAQFEANEPGKIKASILFGEADGIWIPLQKADKRSIEARMAIAYTDKQYISEDRRRLVNKICLTGIGITSEEWQVMIREKLYAHYDLEAAKAMIIGGDGSAWVSHSFDLVGIKQTQRVLDLFHVKQSIHRAFGGVLDTKQVIEQLYKHGFEAVEKTLLLATVGGTPASVEAQLECLQYLRNHKDEIVPALSLGAIESNVGKHIAQRMKTRGVSWSLAGAKAMLAILGHQNKLFEHSFAYQKAKSDQPKKSKRRKHVDAGSVHSASFPVLKTGKISAPYAPLFKAIINENLSLSS